MIVRHIFALIRACQLRFRLETYGLYYPELPGMRPWWRVSVRGFALLARSGRPYLRWLCSMQQIANGERIADRATRKSAELEKRLERLYPELGRDA